MGATGSSSNPCAEASAERTGSRTNPWHPATHLLYLETVRGPADVNPTDDIAGIRARVQAARWPARTDCHWVRSGIVRSARSRAAPHRLPLGSFGDRASARRRAAPHRLPLGSFGDRALRKRRAAPHRLPLGSFGDRAGRVKPSRARTDCHWVRSGIVRSARRRAAPAQITSGFVRGSCAAKGRERPHRLPLGSFGDRALRKKPSRARTDCHWVRSVTRPGSRRAAEIATGFVRGTCVPQEAEPRRTDCHWVRLGIVRSARRRAAPAQIAIGFVRGSCVAYAGGSRGRVVPSWRWADRIARERRPRQAIGASGRDDPSSSIVAAFPAVPRFVRPVEARGWRVGRANG